MKTKTPPFLSVIIATFNVEKTLGLTIESILSQSFEDIEILIIDGLSTDRTLDVARSYRSEKISILSEADIGIYDAWNKGVRRASGKWILFLGADDKLVAADSIQRFINSCESNHLFDQSDVVYGDLVVLGNDAQPMARIGSDWRNPWGFEQRFLTSSFPIPIMSTFFKKSAILKEGGFCLDYKIIADIELVIRISKTTRPIYVHDRALTVMGYGGVSTNPHRALTLLNESFKVRRKHALGTLTNFGFLNLAFRQITKYFAAKYLGTRVSSYLITVYQRGKKRKLQSQRPPTW